MSEVPTQPRRRSSPPSEDLAPQNPAVQLLRVALCVSFVAIAVMVVPFARSMRVGDQELYSAYSMSLSRKPDDALRHYEASWTADRSNHDTAQMYAGELARAASLHLSKGGDPESAETRLRQSLQLIQDGHRYPLRSQSNRLRAEILNNLAKIEVNRRNAAGADELTGEALSAVKLARHFVNEPPRNAPAFHHVAFEIALRRGDAPETLWSWRELQRHRAFVNGMPARPAQDLLLACARTGNGAFALVEARRQLLLNPGAKSWAGALALSRGLPYGERNLALVLEELRGRDLLLPDVEQALQQR